MSNVQAAHFCVPPAGIRVVKWWCLEPTTAHTSYSVNMHSAPRKTRQDAIFVGYTPRLLGGLTHYVGFGFSENIPCTGHTCRHPQSACFLMSFILGPVNSQALGWPNTRPCETTWTFKGNRYLPYRCERQEPAGSRNVQTNSVLSREVLHAKRTGKAEQEGPGERLWPHTGPVDTAASASASSSPATNAGLNLESVTHPTR